MTTSGSSSSGSGSSSQEEDYEALLSELEEDLQVVYTVPLQQVRAVLTRREAAMRKEIENLMTTDYRYCARSSSIRVSVVGETRRYCGCSCQVCVHPQASRTARRPLQEEVSTCHLREFLGG